MVSSSERTMMEFFFNVLKKKDTDKVLEDMHVGPNRGHF